MYWKAPVHNSQPASQPVSSHDRAIEPVVFFTLCSLPFFLFSPSFSPQPCFPPFARQPQPPLHHNSPPSPLSCLSLHTCTHTYTCTHTSPSPPLQPHHVVNHPSPSHHITAQPQQRHFPERDNTTYNHIQPHTNHPQITHKSPTNPPMRPWSLNALSSFFRRTSPDPTTHATSGQTYTEYFYY